jgi:hypothetical protein
MFSFKKKGVPPPNPHQRPLGSVALILAAAIIGSPTPNIAAQTTRSLEGAMLECSERDSNFQRLECYDALAERLIQSTPRAAAPRLGSANSIEVEKPKSKESAKQTQASLQSRREVRMKSGAVLRPELKLACGVDRAATVSVGLKLPAGKVAVNSRVDREEVVKELWSVAPDRNSVIPPNAAGLLKRLHGGKVLEIKVAPRKVEPIPFSFDLGAIAADCPEILSRSE